MKKCKEYRTEIEGAEQPTELGAEARAHVESCARCREFYEGRAEVVRLVGELRRVAAPNDFEFRLRARLAAAESERRPSLLRRGFVPGAISISLAALFAFAVALALRPGQRNEMRPAVARVGEDVPATPSPLSSQQRLATSEATEEQGREAARILAATAESESRRHAAPVSMTVQRASSSAAAKGTGEGAQPGKGRSVTAEFSSRPAPAIGAPSFPSTDIARTEVPIAVPLHTSTQPLRVVVRDERGGSRVVAMKSVSFGAQQLVGQLDATPRSTLTPEEGVW